MTKFLLCIFLLCTLFTPLFAQTQGEARAILYVQQVTGGTQEDNLFLTNLLTVELQAYDFIITQNHEECDYTFIGLLTPESSQSNGSLEGIYNLQIMLLDNRLDDVIAVQSLIYSSSNKEVLSSIFQFLIIRMLATITPNVDEIIEHHIISTAELSEPKAATSLEDDSWRNKHVYLGAYLAWAPRAYSGEFQSVFLPNICAGATMEIIPRSKFSVGVGILITSDWVSLDPAGEADYRELLVEVPFSLRLIARPSTHFMLEPYAGIICNYSLYSTIKPPPISWMAGFQYGVRAGKGVLYVDPRFSMDITKTRLNEVMGGRVVEFDRIKMYVGIGYKIGL